MPLSTTNTHSSEYFRLQHTMKCRIHSFTHTVVTVTFTPLVSARFILDLKSPI